MKICQVGDCGWRNQLCDLVQIRTVHGGTVVRLHKRRTRRR